MRLLFPFIGTIRRLQLRQYWWHRLLLLAFFASLLASLLTVWIGLNKQEMHGLQDCISLEVSQRAKGRTYISVYEECARLYPVHSRGNLGIAVGLTVVLSYLLQVLYRLFIFVVFGKTKGTEGFRPVR